MWAREGHRLGSWAKGLLLQVPGKGTPLTWALAAVNSGTAASSRGFLSWRRATPRGAGPVEGEEGILRETQCLGMPLVGHPAPQIFFCLLNIPTYDTDLTV